MLVNWEMDIPNKAETNANYTDHTKKGNDMNPLVLLLQDITCNGSKYGQTKSWKLSEYPKFIISAL